MAGSSETAVLLASLLEAGVKAEQSCLTLLQNDVEYVSLKFCLIHALLFNYFNKHTYYWKTKMAIQYISSLSTAFTAKKHLL
jgi:hypothetical protein